MLHFDPIARPRGDSHPSVWKRYLALLAKDINARGGTVNCAHCALRFNAYLHGGYRPGLPPVPKSSAGLLTHAFRRKDGRPGRSFSTDARLWRVCVKETRAPARVKLAENEQRRRKGQPELSAVKYYTRLRRTTPSEINKHLRGLAKRSRDGTASGFVTIKYDAPSPPNFLRSHIFNFFIDANDQVYFIDAQREAGRQVTCTLNLKHPSSEVFFVSAEPNDDVAPDAIAPLKREVIQAAPFERAIESTPDDLFYPETAQRYLAEASTLGKKAKYDLFTLAMMAGYYGDIPFFNEFLLPHAPSDQQDCITLLLMTGALTGAPDDDHSVSRRMDEILREVPRAKRFSTRHWNALGEYLVLQEQATGIEWLHRFTCKNDVQLDFAFLVDRAAEHSHRVALHRLLQFCVREGIGIELPPCLERNTVPSPTQEGCFTFFEAKPYFLSTYRQKRKPAADAAPVSPPPHGAPTYARK